MSVLVTHAVDVPCPTCSSPAGVVCTNPSPGHYHQARVSAAQVVTRDANRSERAWGPFACPCGYTSDADPSSSAWHKGHRVAHVARYPKADAATLTALDKLVDVAERGEIRAAEALS